MPFFSSSPAAPKFCEPSDIANRLKGFTVKAIDGTQVEVSSLWSTRPVLLTMFRRWGCGICRMGAVNVSQIAPFLEEHNVRIVGFGFEHVGLSEFVQGNFFSGELFIDEERKSYEALCCKKTSWRNLWGILSKEIYRLFKQSKKMGIANNFAGNANQLGGTFLIFPDGTVPYAHFQSPDSFEPDLNKVLSLLAASKCSDVPNSHQPCITAADKGAAYQCTQSADMCSA